MTRLRPALLAGLVVVALAACAPSPPPGGAASARTLTVATTTDVVSFNPLVGTSRTDNWITNLMYPRLLGVGDDGRKDAGLATRWGYTSPTRGFYEIRGDMSWTDGRRLTADDVAWTVNAVKRDRPGGTLTGQLTNLASATAVSPTRVELQLSRPDASIVEEIGFWGNVVPRHVFGRAPSVATFANREADNRSDTNPRGWVSAGPFRLTEVSPGQSYVLDRVASYPPVPGGPDRATRVVFRVYPDVNTELLALQSGEIDVIANTLPPTQVVGLRSAPGITVQEVAGLGFAHLQYNLDRPDLARVQVRRALAHTVDSAAIRSIVLRGQAVSTGSSPIVPVLTDYAEPGREYAYDPALARRLLTEAGYVADAAGNFPLRFRMIYSLQDPVTSQWAALVRDGGRAAGVTIELAGSERNAYLARTEAGDYDIYAGNFAIMDDPVTNMTLAYLPDGAINYGKVDDPALSALIEGAQGEQDRATRVEMMKRAARLVRDQVYDNVLYTQNLYVAHRAQWSGFEARPSELLSIVNPGSLARAERRVSP